jgi:hypothetical protein
MEIASCHRILFTRLSFDRSPMSPRDRPLSLVYGSSVRDYRRLPAATLSLPIPGHGGKGDLCVSGAFFLSAFGFRFSRLLLC